MKARVYFLTAIQILSTLAINNFGKHRYSITNISSEKDFSTLIVKSLTGKKR